MNQLPIHTRPISLIAVALGGFVTALAFPLQPIPMLPAVALWPLAFIGPAPFLARLLTAESYRSAGTAAVAFAIPWFFVVAVWVFRVFDVLGWVLVWIPIFWIMIFAFSAHAVRMAGLSVGWCWPLLWVAVEFVRAEWSPLRLNLLDHGLDPLNFTWFGLGHPRLMELLWAQSADLAGGYFLAVLPFLTNLLLARIWVTRSLSISLTVAVALLLAAELGYGKWRLAEPAQGPEVTVGVVQSERFQLQVLVELTAQLLADEPATQVVVWPEESFTGTPAQQDALHRFAREHSVALAVGVEALNEDGTHRNMCWWLPSDGDPGEYAKRQRVPFVEQHAASLECPTFALTVGDAIIPVGLLICYDMDFAWNPRQAVACGAELFLMPTLDETGWGGTQHSQHALLPRLRAIENRRAVAQAATSGVSQIIDDRGRVLAEIPYRLNKRPDRPTVYREGYTTATIRASKVVSPYTAGGWLAGPAAAMLAIGLVAFAVVRRFSDRLL